MSNVYKWFNANSLEINFNSTHWVPVSISKVKNVQVNEEIKDHVSKY